MKLIKLSDGSFVIRKDKQTLVGDRLDAAKYLIDEEDCLPSEVALAFDSFETSANNIAHFGLNKTYIYSEQKEVMKDGELNVEAL